MTYIVSLLDKYGQVIDFITTETFGPACVIASDPWNCSHFDDLALYNTVSIHLYGGDFDHIFQNPRQYTNSEPTPPWAEELATFGGLGHG
jgi:hypothetical protein